MLIMMVTSFIGDDPGGYHTCGSEYVIAAKLWLAELDLGL